MNRKQRTRKSGHKTVSAKRDPIALRRPLLCAICAKKNTPVEKLPRVCFVCRGYIQ